MKKLGAIRIPGLDVTCFGKVSQSAKVRFATAAEATEAVVLLIDRGLDGYAVDASLVGNPVPKMAVPQGN